MLERGVAPWQKPWEPGVSSPGIPLNPNSERAYRGGNAIHLMATGRQRGYEDPRWMTYKQASDNGWQVRRGEKGTQIEYWEVKPASDKTQLGGTEQGNADSEKSRLIHRMYTVFNAQQIERIPPYTPKQQTTIEAVQAGEQILENSGANIKHDQADRAFYSRPQDSIHLPPKEAFKDAAAYYGTALHELAHWSGYPSRLDRSTLSESYRFGDANYAKEELRAELASVFLAAQRGIPHDPEQHAAYVNSWIGVLKRDKNEIFRAAHDASTATDFILALERDKSIGEEALAIGTALTAEASGTSPAAVLKPETEELRRDRQQVEEKESDTTMSAYEVAILEPADNAKQIATDPRTAVDAPSGDSLTEAKSITAKVLGDSAKTLAAQTESGSYRGPIIGETDTRWSSANPPAPLVRSGLDDLSQVEALSRALGARQGGDSVELPNGQSPESDYNGQNMQSRKATFLAAARNRQAEDYLRSTREAPLSRYEIKAGWEIPAVLEQSLNSNLPGDLKALVTSNVYDTASGLYLVIPQGSRLIGKYDSRIAYGQGGVEVVWSRIVYPDASSVDLDGMVGLDSHGNAGLCATK